MTPRSNIPFMSFLLCYAFTRDIFSYQWLNGRLFTRGLIFRLDELGQTFVIRLVISLRSIKKGARRIIRLDELSRLLCDLNERTMVMNAAGLSENTLNFDFITKKATFQLGWKNWESIHYQFLYLK